MENVYVFNGDNAYARFAHLLASLLKQVVIVISKDSKKGISKSNAVTPGLLGYRHGSGNKEEKDAKLTTFDDNTTFHLFECDRSSKDSSTWGSATVLTYSSLVIFMRGLQTDHEHLFAPETIRRAEELDTYRLFGKKGLRVLGLTPKAIKRLEDSIKFE
jgi:hypothetical protein